MKPLTHLIWSPLVYSISGFAMALAIVFVEPTSLEFKRFVLLAMPTAGLFIGWFLAYLATPIKMRPDTTFLSDAIKKDETGVKATVIPTE